MSGNLPIQIRAVRLGRFALGLVLWVSWFVSELPQVATGQTLGGLRGDVRQGPASTPSVEAPKAKSKKSRKRDCDDHCDDTDYSGVIMLTGLAVGYTVTSPYWLPRSIVDDETFEPGYFARYPYRGDLWGYMATDPDAAAEDHPWIVDDHYNWLLRTRFEYGDTFGDLSYLGGQVLLDSASRWGFDTEVRRFEEEVTPRQSDSLWMGDANVVFRFAQSPRLQMRSGLGMNWLSDTVGSEFGFNFTYGGDFFPADPWIISAEIDWGRLGEAGLFHGRTTIGIQFHRLEVYTGYDYLDIGSTQINSLVSGLRLWY